MTTTITVNGVPHRVVNAYSCGRGCTPHTYDLTTTNGPTGICANYVYEIAGRWFRQTPGNAPILCDVEVVS